MRSNFFSAQVVLTRLVFAVGVIQNDKIKLHLVMLECPPSLFQQRGRVGTIEHSTTALFDGIQHGSHAHRVICRKSHHRIQTRIEVFQWVDLVNPNVQLSFSIRGKQTVLCEVSNECLRSSHCRLFRRIEMEHGRSNYAERGAARKQMREVEMIGVGMSLQAVADLVQRTRVHLSRHHYVGTKINKQVRVDQHSRAFAQTRAAEYPCLRAVLTFAKRLWEGICGGRSKKSDSHQFSGDQFRPANGPSLSDDWRNIPFHSSRGFERKRLVSPVITFAFTPRGSSRRLLQANALISVRCCQCPFWNWSVIQFLLRHASVQTTEWDFCRNQNLRDPINDRFA